MSNNQEETYSFLMACQIAKKMGYKLIQFLGDSELLIKVLNSEDHSNNVALNNSPRRIQNILKEFETVSSFHIPHELNKNADVFPNKAFLLSQGNLNMEASRVYPCMAL